MAAEVELKLSIEPGALAAVRRHPALARLRGRSRRTARIISTYYDTPEEELRKAGVALRVRRSGERWLQTVKDEGTQLAGMQHRDRSSNGRSSRRASTQPS